ncbi:hypothetical protein Vadar_001898 [Vaccinium darrowii]|uniref:Uncharacterized protein n=1 Tax=Vaccinium darrowii TaxID=229202 RepID=A0ACB7XMV6_9ERIC|nr:hypothetical protein Vadar_001898 [Vaccinium darrowii]
MALGGIISVVGQIGKCLLDPIGRHFGYLYHYKSNLESLVKEFNILEPLRCTEQLKVDGAERNGEEILPSVKEWLGSVDLISSEVNVILEEVEVFPREEAWNLFKEIAGISRALGNLNQLKLLDLLRCHVRRIPHGVLSSLSKLEELYLGTSFSRWDVVEEVKDITITNACIAELALLPNLVALDIYVPHTECSVWPSDVVLPENIRAFDISLGDIRGKNACSPFVSIDQSIGSR